MKHHLQFLILKYAKHAVSNDSISIGILVYETDTGSYAETRFLNTWERVSRLDPNADTEVLEGLKTEIETDWSDVQKRKSLIAMLLRSFSNTLVVQERSCFTDDPGRELEVLASLHL